MASINYTNAKKYRHWGQEDEEEPGGGEAEARKRIVRELVHKQLSKRNVSVEQQLGNKIRFVKSTPQETAIGSTSGLASYEKFRNLESTVNAKEVLRSLGLSDADVRLLYESEGSRKSCLEAPDARRERLEAIERKLSTRTKPETNTSDTYKDKHNTMDTNDLKKHTNSYSSFESDEETKRTQQQQQQHNLSQPNKAPVKQGNQKPQEEEEEDLNLNPYQIHLRNQLREIAHRLFPSDQNERMRSGKGNSSVCFKAERRKDTDNEEDDISSYLTEEMIGGEPFPAENANELVGKRKSEAGFDFQERKRDRKESNSLYLTEETIGGEAFQPDDLRERKRKSQANPEFSDAKKYTIDSECVYLTEQTITDEPFADNYAQRQIGKGKSRSSLDFRGARKGKRDSQFIYLTEKPKSFWDMDKIPKIIQSSTSYPSVPRPSPAVSQGCRDTLIRVARTTNRKGDERKTVKVTKSTKAERMNESGNDDGRRDNRVNEGESDEKNTKVEKMNERKDGRVNEGESDVEKNMKVEKMSERKDEKVNEGDKNNENKNKTNNIKDKDVIDETHKNRENETKTTTTNKNKNNHTTDDSDKNTNTNQIKTKTHNKNNTRINTKTRTIIQVSRTEPKPDTTKPFILTLPESKLIPLGTIKTNRVPTQDLRKIDKFRNYEEGTPTQTLYLKNISSAVSPSDLAALMGHFETPDGPKITYRVLGGRMKGQAFVTFPDVRTATNALETCNGFLFDGKPLVIAYGKKG